MSDNEGRAREVLDIADGLARADQAEAALKEAQEREVAWRVTAEATGKVRDRLTRYILQDHLPEAPCPICGYNGPGYYQPSRHPCAGLTGPRQAALKGMP